MNERIFNRHGQGGSAPLRRVKLTQDLSSDPDTGAMAKFVGWGDGEYFDYRHTLSQVRVFPGPGGVTMSSGSYCWVTFAGDSQRWEVVTGAGGSGFVHFTLNADLDDTDSTAAATVVRGWGGTDKGSGDSITVNNVPDPAGGYLFEAASGTIGMASYDAANDKWWIVWLKCNPPA